MTAKRIPEPSAQDALTDAAAREINQWMDREINSIPSLLRTIGGWMGADENLADRVMDLTERLENLRTSDDREALLAELRDTDSRLGALAYGLACADESLERGNPYMALAFTLQSLREYVTVAEWRPDAVSRSVMAARNDASHAVHRSNKQTARDWYAAHKNMTKDAAAEKMAKDGVIRASFRTIRGYLTGL